MPAERNAEPGPLLGIRSPLGLANLSHAALRVYRTRPRLYVALYFLVYLAIHLLQLGGVLALETLAPGELMVSAFQVLLGIVLVALIGTLLLAAVVPLMTSAVLGRDAAAGSGLRLVRSRLDRVVAAGLLASMVSMVTILPPFSLLLILGSAIVLAALQGPPVMIHALTLEGMETRPAWDRTRHLMRGSWLRVFAHVLTIVLGLWVAQIVVAGLVGNLLFASQLRGVPLEVALAVAQSLFAAVALPYVAAAWLVIYLEARRTKDALSDDDLRTELSQSLSAQPGFTGP